MTAHRRFLLLLGLFIIAVLIHTANLPVMEGSDEILHHNYVEYLRRENSLPDRLDRRTNGIAQASGQPPLAYWLIAVPLRLFNVPSIDPQQTLHDLERVENRWHWPRDSWQQQDNKNVYYHGAGEIVFGNPLLVTINRAMRWSVLVMGVVAVIGAYGAAREVFQDERWALTATALFAFTPTMIHSSAYVTNDTAAIAFSTLAIWQTLRLLRRGAAATTLILMGVLLALAGLSKINSLLIAPGIAIALLLDAHKSGSGWRGLLRSGLRVGLPFALIFGPWVLYGAALYGDPLGISTHQYEGLGFYSPVPRPLAETLEELPGVYLSYWGKFLHVLLEPSTYHALGLILVLAAAGFAIRARRLSLRLLPLQQGLVLGIMVAALLAGLFRWMQQLQVVGARLIYPGDVGITVGITAGLLLLARHRPRLGLYLRVYSAGMVMAAGLLLSPLTLRSAYGPPPLLQRDQLPPLQGQPIDYEGIIRFLGYVQESVRLEGMQHTITLCWEVLQATRRPAAFSIKFVRSSPVIADRTSIFGMGHFPSALWRPGDIFCDTVNIRVDDPDIVDEEAPVPAYVYDMLLVLLDADTLDVNWQAAAGDGTPLEFPIIGPVVSPAGDLSAGAPDSMTPTRIHFPGFAALHSYALSGQITPGAQLDLTLLWDVTGQTPDDWTQFIHLIGPDTAVVLADGAPRQGDYPTWAWFPGERIVDTWRLTIPESLSPGEYALHIGFYRRDTGERKPAADAAGPVENSSPMLARVNMG